jgi:hypothetical protein
MQDLEFTIEKGKLWMLQTRAGKRTAKAALKIAVDMVAEGLLTEEEAVFASSPAHSISCCTRPSIRRPSVTFSDRAAGLAGRGVGRNCVHLR